MPEDIGASERMLGQWQQSIEQKAERYQEMAARVQGMTISEASRDGSVKLTIGSNGILTNLEIAESARDKRMAEVSAEVMRTLQRAQARIPELLQQAMAETIGTQDETANVLFNEAKRNFPSPPHEEPAPPPVGREMRFGIEDDDTPAPPASRPGPPSTPPSAPPPTRRPARRPDEDDDFGGQSFLS
ncbi:YbaB/EbfC family nucleoid-associated protein [Saccharothrix luteola]|uniref:YbaB/EbfC family nucleoid-associated protein n=1 Tax=Saccharothrix luteola TaxID=2893018 RepID=UPI001E6571CD|nr:YbaB/EbfC family nucleoid-associated protein [Saccharothrix luteola]MCC8251110.1 YbaB/EbfC family nucleoid-associated protein [Saccharothrix luteola]